MKPGTVIFDLDGTLLNTLDDIGDSMNRVLAYHGLPTHPPDAFRFLVGEGSGRLVEKAIPPAEAHRQKALLCDFIEDYSHNWNHKTHIYPGISEMLDQLKPNYNLCVLSNKPDKFTKACVSHYFPPDHFAVVRGHVEGFPRKPDPHGVYEISKLLNKPVNDFVFMGDTKYDVQTAKGVGIPCVGVTWGFRPQSELEEYGVDYVIHHPSELHSIMNLLGKKQQKE